MNQQNYFADGVVSNKYLYNGKELQDDELAGGWGGMIMGGECMTRSWGGGIAAAVVRGTASELVGGKFANGAATGAYTMLFNYMAHRPEEPPSTTWAGAMATATGTTR